MDTAIIELIIIPPAGISLYDMVIHRVQQGDHRVVGVGPLYLVRVPLVKTELAISERYKFRPVFDKNKSDLEVS